MTKKGTKNRSESARAVADLPLMSLGTQRSPEDQKRIDALKPEAAAILRRVQDRMVAMASIAIASWDPDAALTATDEDDDPVLELDDLLTTLDTLAEVSLVREMSAFMGLPSSLVDPVLVDMLRAAYVPSPSPAPRRDSRSHFVVAKPARRGGGGDNE